MSSMVMIEKNAESITWNEIQDHLNVTLKGSLNLNSRSYSRYEKVNLLEELLTLVQTWFRILLFLIMITQWQKQLY